MENVKIKRALISVSDKRGIIDFSKGLQRFGVEIISTGGTAKSLEEAGAPVTKVSAVTGFPEILDGRVKTLHPKIHGALLAIRDSESHMKQLEEHNITPIDLVAVNLYPFAETIAKEGVTLEEAVEQIDIGGPSMIRSAAKNFEGVVVVVEPERYDEILAEMKENDGCVTRETRKDLARDAFKHTASYDETIYEYLEGEKEFPPQLELIFEKIMDLRYGENPHQKAAYYRDENASPYSLVHAQQLHGKELSYNNILDLDAAWSLVNEFSVPAAVIIKHTNPCGSALADDIAIAYEKALACDPVSAFGGIIALNRPVSEEVAKKIAETFVEAVIAPAFLEEAIEILTKKKDIRLMCMGEKRERYSGKDIRRVDGGVLIQDKDLSTEERSDMKVVSKRKPSDKEWGDLLFGWRIAKHVKSNAIVITKDLQSIGVGAGQMSRVDASELAIKKAGVENCKGAVLASDAFFPFPDALAAAAKAGIKAFMEPGGSIRDEEVIATANKYDVALVFTGKRHFKH
jgi:phosphoribosylaminoimidazolecarboxamide formyltransferase/IMP cyclohydrolase